MKEIFAFTIFRPLTALMLLCLLGVGSLAQGPIPAPGAPRPIVIPAVKEIKLPNSLTIAVIEKKEVPIVTAQLLVRTGASSEAIAKAGLANLTASMLTKGTKTRSAEQIAEQVEFLGGSLNSGAGWNNSLASVTVTSDKLDQAMTILGDVILNPAFSQSELDLLKSQELDGLTYNLKQPGFLASYVASRYSFSEHPAGGTPASLASIGVDDVRNFHTTAFRPERSVLIFAGDITVARAEALARKIFGAWRGPSSESSSAAVAKAAGGALDMNAVFRRILVVDMPKSGQAVVSYQKRIDAVGRQSTSYYPAGVLNSLLGGGYSSRLNQEIRIKRGLSYGAGSNFGWRNDTTNFGARTQTKNESAAEVLELVAAEIKRLTTGEITTAELMPRKSVLTGSFGRNLETTQGLASAVGDLYSFGVPVAELNRYSDSVNAVSEGQIREFAGKNLLGGDVI
ncbi:MAG: M16 family metallopeptidase, partial [Pyrinomonadaceae bacterium]